MTLPAWTDQWLQSGECQATVMQIRNLSRARRAKSQRRFWEGSDSTFLMIDLPVLDPESPDFRDDRSQLRCFPLRSTLRILTGMEEPLRLAARQKSDLPMSSDL